MSNSDLLQPAPLWAEQELGSVPIGDRRRTKRLVTVTTALALQRHFPLAPESEVFYVTTHN